MRCLALVLTLASSTARANGAFPDSLGLYLPGGDGSHFALATNFGLVVSNDAGASWHLVCENAVISFASLYALGPDNAIYAVSTLGLVASRDGACSFQAAAGSLTLAAVDDVFPDPTDAMHVWALARQIGDGGLIQDSALYESTDGAASFGDPRWRPPSGHVLKGVESARSDPKTLYVTSYAPGPHPYLARSTDGGASFLLVDQGALGASILRIIAVDPKNPQRLFLRVTKRDGESLGVSDDGGATVRDALDVPSALTAFLLRADGSVLVGARDGTAFRSSDGAQTFAPWTVPIHLRGLAEHAGTIYAVGDNTIDGFAIATSTDNGATFTPMFRYAQIAGPATCGNVASTCAGPWAMLQVTLQLGDGGATPSPSSMPMPKHGGCALGAPTVALAPLLMVALVIALACRRRAKWGTKRG
jgi:hypothetical protein